MTAVIEDVLQDAAEDGEALGDLPTPQPVPDLETYLRVRRTCLSRSPARLRNYLAYQASGRRSADPAYLPIRLDFENVSRCNFRCTMCTVSDWHKGTRATDMPLQAFKRLIDEQVGLVEIKVQGLGEPTLQGDDFFEMIRYARARHIWVRTTTNASLLHLKDNYRKLIDSGVNEVQISCDGADKETFESIRRGSVFERVVENCKLINAYCAGRNIERTKMWTVVQRNNRHQLAELVDLAHEMGFRSMAFSLNLGDFGLDRWRAVNDAVTVEREFSRAEALALLKQGERLGVKVAFWNVTQRFDTARPEHLCPWPFERAYVASDLRVAPCCIIGNPDVSQVGTADGGFTGAWTGNTMREFRQAHLDGRIPAVCRSCYTARDQQQ
jgi:MoaA/NifB/PqqE/SkfB family radical SAM enzyme